MRPEKNNKHEKDLLNDSALYSQPQEEDSFNMLYSEAEEVSGIDDNQKLLRQPSLFEDTRSDLKALNGFRQELDKMPKA